MESKMERRLATIMATDVVGYSRLMGLDERGTLQSLKLSFPLSNCVTS